MNSSNKLWIFPSTYLGVTGYNFVKQITQWATIAHCGASITFGDTIIYNAHRQVTLNFETVIRNLFKHSGYYASSRYLQVLIRSE